VSLDEAEYRRWLEAARETLESAGLDLEGGYYNWACFKAQQAAELAVRGLLHGIGAHAYGHSVALLLERASASLGWDVPGDLVECGKLLDKYYVPTRYPNAWAEGAPHYYYTRREASEAIACARLVVEWVEEAWRRLSGAARGRG